MTEHLIRFYLMVNHNSELFKKSIVILYLLGFRWASNENPNNCAEMFIIRNDSDIASFMLRVSDDSFILRYRSLINNVDSEVFDIPEIKLDILFEILNETYKSLIQNSKISTRLDISKNPCITIIKDYDLVFKNNQIYAYSVDSEIESEICDLLEDYPETYKDKLNETIFDFQKQYSFKADFKKLVIQKLLAQLKTNL